MMLAVEDSVPRPLQEFTQKGIFMPYLRALPTIAVFLIAVYVFQLSPEGKAEFFQGFGITLKDRTYTALCILGMVFGALFSLRLIGDAWIAERR